MYPLRFFLAASLFASISLCQSCSATRFAHQINQEYEPPEAIEIESMASFSLSDYDEVWESVISFFATKQIGIEAVEKDSGIIVARKQLTASSGGDGIALLGLVRTKRFILKQWLEPSQYQGSANPDVVRATGKVVRAELIEGSLQESAQKSAYGVTVSFNVFVSRFSDSEVRVQVNLDTSAAMPLELYRGWVWDVSLPEDLPVNEPDLINRLRKADVGPISVDPQPVSTGVLEKALLNYIRARVSADS